MGQALRASVYRQAAIARLAEAEYLKRAYPSGAIYLGGYVVECMLKWAICQRHGVIYFENLSNPKLAAQLMSARGHDLGFLLDASGLRPLRKSNKLLYNAFTEVSGWSVALRYNPSTGDVRVAARFMDGVNALRVWLEGIC